MRARWDIAAARRIRKLIRLWRPQVVHVHDLNALTLAQTALVGFESLPIVFSCRTIPHRIGALRRAGRHPARFTAPNREVLRYLVSIGVHAAAVDIVPPGVSVPGGVTPRDWRKECRWPQGVSVCGVIGATGVGARASLRSVTSLLPEESREKLRIVVLGGASSGEGRIAGVAAFHAGFVDEIAPALAGLDFLCNLSGAESMGTATLDAMALRVPSVAYEAGGAGEYIENGRSGLVVPWGDSVAFAAAVSSLVNDRELRDTLAAFARARVSIQRHANGGSHGGDVPQSAACGRGIEDGFGDSVEKTGEQLFFGRKEQHRAASVPDSGTSGAGWRENR